MVIATALRQNITAHATKTIVGLRAGPIASLALIVIKAVAIFDLRVDGSAAIDTSAVPIADGDLARTNLSRSERRIVAVAVEAGNLALRKVWRIRPAIRTRALGVNCHNFNFLLSGWG